MRIFGQQRPGGPPRIWGYRAVQAVLALCVVVQGVHGVAGEVSPEDAQFFEEKIRPILAAQCFECHSDSIQAKGGLRLDIAAGPRIGGQRGVSIVPGHPELSLLIKSLKYEGQVRMPPGAKLDDEEIADFEEWIRRGAPDPRQKAAEPLFAPRNIDWKEEGKLWSLQPLAKPAEPAVKDAAWSTSSLDKFVLAKLEEKGIAPAKDADKGAWLRRVYYDLTGLPPSVGELLDFELDNSPAAKEKVVDRLLASPRFGERWGRHWLDVARYAESTGKERNFVYLQAWRYRDYVIDSFNADKPFDQFVVEQVAGDLLPHKDDTERDLHQIATGFLAVNPKGINDRNRESFLLEIVDEQIESVTRGFMGLSVGCARCHDHKYDPVSQADYYAIGGILRSTEAKFGILNRTRYISEPDLLLPLASAELTRGETTPAEDIARVKAWGAELLEKNRQLGKLRDKLPPPPPPSKEEVAAAGVVTTVDLNGAATTSSLASARNTEPKTEEEKAFRALDEQIKKETKELEELRAKVTRSLSVTTSIGVIERPDPSDIPIRVRGEVDKIGPVIPRGFLTVLQTESTPKVNPSQSGRLELAKWVASRDNPLTARVYVNRVWSKLLGTGLVATVDNFGAQGDAPTHPELLDHLASTFIDKGWSTKKLIREIVLSRFYGIGSDADAKNAEVDFENKLYWRWNPKRLEGEVLRDTLLLLGGNLDTSRPFGTPLVEMGTRELGVDANYSVVLREYPWRSVYLPFIRGRAPEMLAVFDSPDPGLTVGKRDVTAGPDQALYLLNSPTSLVEAKGLAARLLAAPVDDAGRVDLAFRLAFGVAPTKEQRERSLQAVAHFESLQASVASTTPVVVDAAVAKRNAWAIFAQTLFALPEFRYVF
jgi:hypothetical protein